MLPTCRFALLLLSIAGPVAVLASPASDRKIEQAVASSYHYRTLLEDRVIVKVLDGVATLTGTVHDKDDKALAADTVENVRGVKGVKNELTIVSTHAERTDPWIAAKIRTQLLVKAGVSATTTTIAVKEGVVTLGGTATTRLQRELTETYAGEIAGVKGIANTIVVNDVSVPGETTRDHIDDASITTQVKYALLRHHGTSALKTQVSTNAGRIVIAGGAGSAAEKALVTKLAHAVRGVKSVRNAMTVGS